MDRPSMPVVVQPSNTIRVARLKMLFIAAKIRYHGHRDEVLYSVHEQRAAGLMFFMKSWIGSRNRLNDVNPPCKIIFARLRERRNHGIAIKNTTQKSDNYKLHVQNSGIRMFEKDIGQVTTDPGEINRLPNTPEYKFTGDFATRMLF